MHHLGANLDMTPLEYIQNRFYFGEDKEVGQKVTMQLSGEEVALSQRQKRQPRATPLRQRPRMDVRDAAAEAAGDVLVDLNPAVLLYRYNAAVFDMLFGAGGEEAKAL